MGAAERREAILRVLNTRRKDKIANLAVEFGVSERTVRSDIEALSCTYPITTRRGRYGGGVEIAEDFHLNRKMLTVRQADLLKRLAGTLKGEDRVIMDSILTQFAL